MRVDSFDPEAATEVEDGVRLKQLSTGARTSVQGFRIEPGAEVPEHSHPHEQSGHVHAGELTFHVDGETRVVAAGDAYVIPADEPHRAVNEGDDPVEGVDVFSPPRSNPDWA